MTAEPTHDREFFTAPQQANQRRYEALRAYFVDQVSVAQAGERAGYTLKLHVARMSYATFS